MSLRVCENAQRNAACDPIHLADFRNLAAQIREEPGRAPRVSEFKEPTRQDATKPSQKARSTSVKAFELGSGERMLKAQEDLLRGPKAGYDSMASANAAMELMPAYVRQDFLRSDVRKFHEEFPCYRDWPKGVNIPRCGIFLSFAYELARSKRLETELFSDQWTIGEVRVAKSLSFAL